MYQNDPYMATAVIRDCRPISWRLVGAYVVGFLGAAIGMGCPLLLLSYKRIVAGQMMQISRAIRREHSDSASNNKNLRQKYNGMAGIESAIIEYNMTCSLYLTGPCGGPTTFIFLVGTSKPGG